MANYTQQQNTTSSSSIFSTFGCIALLTVYGIAVIAIVMLNALTIIVYFKERRLRKRSMYLVINQAVADMFAGASLIYNYLVLGNVCDVWTINRFGQKLIFPLKVLNTICIMASLINLGAISLERTHATFRPFKHRLMKKKIFGAAAAIVWITAILTGILFEMIINSLGFEGLRIFAISYLSSFLFCLLTIIVSYSSMAIKIVYGTQPHHRSATNRGRKLTKTLFIVTVLSLLLTLPFMIILFCKIFQLCTPIPSHLVLFFSFTFYANSLVNPVLYTFRIPEFKRALISFWQCRSQPQPAQVFPLNEM